MDEEMEVSEVDDEKAEVKQKVYLPGRPLKKKEFLVHDPSAYIMLHEAQAGAPCLSFDIIPDGDGNDRTEFPLTAYIVAGTQAKKANENSIILMKISDMLKTYKEECNEESSNEESDSEKEESSKVKLPKMDASLIKHQGTVNRIRTSVINGRVLAAAWSDFGSVSVIDLNHQLQDIADPATNTAKYFNALKKKKRKPGKSIVPLQIFTDHSVEGFGLDWSTVSKGVLASGDVKSNIYIWHPNQTGWDIGKEALTGHADSVEDIQWSPNEPNVLASCSVDRTIRIWDTREKGANACKLIARKAHASDINVISWNKTEPFIVSGGDDGFLNIWDLRHFESNKPVAILKHHSQPVTSVEWSPHESSVFASGGEDNQICLWDLAVEKDDNEDKDSELKDLPPQLLFIHQGQTFIKELHWHSQIPGLVISTAFSGFNFFKTISV